MVGIRPALGERFGHGEALGSEFWIQAIHQVFSFRRFYFVFGMDGVNVVVHTRKIENEETGRGIGGSERLEL